VLVDERKARKIARAVYGLDVVGTARTLVEAKRQGLIESVAEPLQLMQDAGYWLGGRLIRRILSEAGEA